MKETVNRCDFHDRFRDFNRIENFTYEAREALFDYLEELEESTDTEIELDVIALCCTYSQDHWEDIRDNYCMEAATQEEVSEITIVWKRQPRKRFPSNWPTLRMSLIASRTEPYYMKSTKQRVKAHAPFNSELAYTGPLSHVSCEVVSKCTIFIERWLSEP